MIVKKAEISVLLVKTTMNNNLDFICFLASLVLLDKKKRVRIFIAFCVDPNFIELYIIAVFSVK